MNELAVGVVFVTLFAALLACAGCSSSAGPSLDGGGNDASMGVDASKMHASDGDTCGDGDCDSGIELDYEGGDAPDDSSGPLVPDEGGTDDAGTDDAGTDATPTGAGDAAPRDAGDAARPTDAGHADATLDA